MPMSKETNERRRVVRHRNLNTGSETRPYGVRIRVTREVSARLASIQGLCWRYGKRETLADMWEAICMPALAAYVRPYADKARRERHIAAVAKLLEDGKVEIPRADTKAVADRASESGENVGYNILCVGNVRLLRYYEQPICPVHAYDIENGRLRSFITEDGRLGEVSNCGKFISVEKGGAE